ncbi:MAG: hypothetical protein JO113_06155 [Candidatus Eremiobacteraeota bacterium]|nr:hypothetical protein [Candidatus Eremiobacteraeota bacterium]
MLRSGLVFSIIIVLYDVVAAAIARSVGVAYNSFLVLALVLFFFMGVYAGRTRRSWSGIVAVAIAAVADATLGWYVAAMIGPGYVPGWTMRGLIVMAVESAVLSIVIGAAGVWVGLSVAGRRREFF